MADLQITATILNSEKPIVLLELQGDIDGHTLPKLQESFNDHLKQGIKLIVIDMSEIVYVNTALGVIVKNADIFRKAGGGMALLKLPPKVKIVIEMLELDSFFYVCKDLDSAKRALLESPPS